MRHYLLGNIQKWLEALGLSPYYSHIFSVGLILFAIVILSWTANYITKNLILIIVSKIIGRTKNKWDDVFLEKKVFQRLSHLAPILVIYMTIGYAFPESEEALDFFDKLINIYILTVLLFVIFAVLSAVNQIYFDTTGRKRGTSIRSYVQVIKIVLSVLFAIFVLAELFDKNVMYYITGMGAMTAVLLLVFKDSILGLVAGVQLTGNDMVRIGDWIEMPSRNADGDVIELTLNTVKVRNFDKTITTIPTYALISESYRNWRGMSESGGRRIMRSIIVDQRSVKFCTPEMLDKFREFKILRDYIDERLKEIEEFNLSHGLVNDIVVNGRKMTNLGMFRKYIEFYLKHHRFIRQDMTLLVRQLAPSEKGIPLQVYAFTKTTDWVDYEGIQADVFDHLLAVVPYFYLNVFQLPSGDDLREFLGLKKP